MKFIVDTEASALHNFSLSHQDKNQAQIVQLGLIVVNEQEKILFELDEIIKPIDFEIEAQAQAAHGITKEYATQHGKDGKEIAEITANWLEQSSEFIAYNESFDRNLLITFFYKHLPIERAEKLHIKLKAMKKTCVMNLSKPIVKMPPTDKMKAAGFGGYKNPKLSEAYFHFFKENFDNAHSAMADCSATYKILKEITKVQPQTNKQYEL